MDIKLTKTNTAGIFKSSYSRPSLLIYDALKVSLLFFLLILSGVLCLYFSDETSLVYWGALLVLILLCDVMIARFMSKRMSSHHLVQSILMSRVCLLTLGLSFFDGAPSIFFSVLLISILLCIYIVYGFKYFFIWTIITLSLSTFAWFMPAKIEHIHISIVHSYSGYLFLYWLSSFLLLVWYGLFNVHQYNSLQKRILNTPHMKSSSIVDDFFADFEQQIQNNGDTSGSLSLVLIDLGDSFSSFENDAHHMKIEFEAQYSKIVSKLSPQGSRLYALGGDEYAFFVSGQESAALSLSDRIDQSLRVLNKNMTLGQDYDTAFNTRVGYAHFPQDGLDTDELCRAADKSALRLKEKG
jgi:GGDEF domain-containing protein